MIIETVMRHLFYYRYVEISRNVKIDSGTRNWQGAADSADGDRSSNSPFTIDLGSTDMQFSFRLYKGCRF